MKTILLLAVLCLATQAEEYFYEYGKKIHLTKTWTRKATDATGLQYYRTIYGHRMAATGEIILKVHNFEHLSYFLKTYPIASYKKLDSNTYLLEPKKKQDLFTLANKMHLDSMSNYAQPNFIREKRGQR